MAAARHQAEPRSHDAGQYEHAATARIATRERELRELRQLAVLGLAEIGDQQRGVRAGAQQRHDLIVMQIADAGMARVWHRFRMPSTNGSRRTRP
jgi:hypothetical protein